MYLNIYYERSNNDFGGNGHIHIWDDVLGYKKVPYMRYAYKLDPNGEYTTIYNQPCKLVKRWKKADVEKGIIFESDIRPEMRYLIDNYSESEIPSDKHVIFNFDIEVSTTGGVPNAYKALNAITSIAYYVNKTDSYTVLLLDPSMKISNSEIEQRGTKIKIETFASEAELLDAFLTYYVTIKPHILTGWNIDTFDIPYLYNRIKKVFDTDIANMLSPINIVEYDEIHKRYIIAGVSSLDMMKLYKNFTFGERQSYSLDSIAKLEVKEGKIKYQGTLDKLYETDKEKFIEYNVHDVRLVKMIDDKMKLIEVSKGICHKGRVPLEDIYYSSRFLDGAILSYIKRKGNIVVPNRPKYAHTGDSNSKEIRFEGAYVKEPIPGKYKWIIDLDYQSLYPSIIRTVNISPETKVCKIKNWKEIQDKFSLKLQ